MTKQKMIPFDAIQRMADEFNYLIFGDAEDKDTEDQAFIKRWNLTVDASTHRCLVEAMLRKVAAGTLVMPKKLGKVICDADYYPRGTVPVRIRVGLCN